MILLGRLSLYGQRAERLHEQLVPVAARWIGAGTSATKPAERLRARRRGAASLELLDDALAGTPHQPAERVRERLLQSAAADVAELLPQLEQRAEAYAADAEQKLRERGERERRDLREILETQRDRVRSELKRYSAEFAQLTLGFADEERRQLEENMRSWERRLAQFERDLASEPDRIARLLRGARAARRARRARLPLAGHELKRWRASTRRSRTTSNGSASCSRPDSSSRRRRWCAPARSSTAAIATDSACSRSASRSARPDRAANHSP